MIRTNYLKALPAALFAIGFAFGAHAQAPASAQPSASGSTSTSGMATYDPSATGRSAKSMKSSLSHSDRKFVEDAAKGDMAEVELAKIAEERASSPQVKQFAQKIEHDHSQAMEKVRQLAQAKGVTMPAGPKWGDKHEASKLQKLSGRKFDQAYMDYMVKDHKKDVKDFKKEAQKAKDPQVKALAQQTTPTLEQHLQLAESADAAVGGKQAKNANANKQARNSASSKGDMKTSMR